MKKHNQILLFSLELLPLLLFPFSLVASNISTVDLNSSAFLRGIASVFGFLGFVSLGCCLPLGLIGILNYKKMDWRKSETKSLSIINLLIGGLFTLFLGIFLYFLLTGSLSV